MFDLARAGLGVYRAHLSVTGENITNATTEGYHRRSIQQTEMVGAQATPLTMPTGGQGVRVADVLRAFDSILADRVRQGSSDTAAAGVHLTTAQAVEDILLPGGDGGIDAALSRFFQAVGALAAAPADTSLRRVVMTTGATLAGTVAGAAAALGRVQADGVLAARAEVADADAALAELAALNDQMGRIRQDTTGAAHPLSDARDRLIARVARVMPVSVMLDAQGRASVTLGTQGTGPVLLDGSGAARLSVTARDQVALAITRGGTTDETLHLTAGSLGGAARGFSLVSDAMAELDVLARRIAGDINSLHRQGVDATGAAGGDLFRLQGWTVEPAAGNTGSGRVTVQTLTATAPRTAVELVFDAPSGLWQARDGSGALLASGAGRIVIDGAVLEVSGQPRDGDRLLLTPRAGRAVDMALAFTDPGRLAPAGAAHVAAGASNAGTAVATIVPAPQLPPALPLLGALLQGAGGAADATDLWQGGAVAHVPAGTPSISLASLGVQAQASFALADPAQAGMLMLDIDGQSLSFDLTGLASSADPAALLNSGQVASATGQVFAGLGLQAAYKDGTLTIARSEGDFAAATLAGAAGVLRPAAGAGGTIQIFTREGRQIAGTPMDPAQAAALITAANGFSATAAYDPGTLNGATGAGYRGTGLVRVSLPGDQAATLPPAMGAQVWAAGDPAPAPQAARVLSLSMAGQAPLALAVPQGGSARDMAALARAALPGLSARAETALALTVQGDGLVSFRLTGRDAAPVPVSASVVAGDLSSLAQAVNGVTAATGIRAEVSPDGTRLLMVQDEGHDISLAGFSHNGGGTLQATPSDASGVALSAGAIVGPGAENLRVGGQVILSGATGFVVDDGRGPVASAPDAGRTGLATVGTEAAGAVRRVSFALDPAFDGPGVSADGTTPSAAATRYEVTVGGVTAAFRPGAGTATAADVAEGMMAALRKEAPLVAVTGAPVTPPPAGLSLTFRLEGQDYTLRMQGGQPVVGGGETGRVVAAFDGTGRLVLSTPQGVTTPGGIEIMGPPQAAAAFGLTAPAQTVQGRQLAAAALPPGGAVLQLSVGGTAHAITLSGAGGAVTATPGAGFPGTVSVGPDGALRIDVPAGAGVLRLNPPGVPGLQVPGAALSVDGAGLVARDPDGQPVSVQAGASGLAGQRLALSELPPEDLIVVMTGGQPLRLAGSAAPPGPVTPRATEVRVADAASALVEVVDVATGHVIASRTLAPDGAGGASGQVGGMLVGLSGGAATGDTFRLVPNGAGSSDGTIADRILSLRSRDAATGAGGFADLLAGLQGEIGARVSGARTVLAAAESSKEAADRAEAALSGVDLDAEAARLIEFQQAYQASAQVMAMARDLFDTLIASM